MASDRRKLQEHTSPVPLTNLPGIRNEMVKDPGGFVIKEGLDFGFVTDFWNGLKKILHKAGVL